MFPENFVKLVKRREPSSLKKEEKREATQRKSVRELANKFKDGVPISVIPKKKEKKKKCKVLFEYKKENDDELELQVGDIIEFHKQVEEGWWEGSLNGKHGVFPSNFVELIEDQSSSDESVLTNSEDKDKNSESLSKEENFQAIKGKKVVGVGLGNIFGSGPIKLRPTGDPGKKEEGTKPVKHGESELAPEVAKREKQNTFERAVVRFSYNAEQPDELSLVEGQIIRILDKELEDEGWWKGELNGKVGVFPDNFVELLPNEETSKPKKPPLPTSAVKQNLPSKISEKAVLDSSDDKIKTENFSFSNAKKGKKYSVSHSSRHSPSTGKRSQIARELSSILEAVEHMGDEDSMVLYRPDARSKLHYYYESSASVTKKPVAPPPIGKKPLNQKPVEQKVETVAPQKVVSLPKDKSSNRENHSDERITDDSRSFDGIEPAGQKLTHLTANRAKGPKKRPPSTVLTLNDGEKESDSMDECKNNFSNLDKSYLQTEKHSHLPDRPEKPHAIIPPKDKNQPQPPSEPEPPSLPTAVLHKEQSVPPPRPPEPNANKAAPPATPTSTNSVNKLIEQLQKELQELKANCVSKSAFIELKNEHEKLKIEFETMRNVHSKKFRELENEVDEEKKLRLTTQVEIERVKKFMSETNV